MKMKYQIVRNIPMDYSSDTVVIAETYNKKIAEYILKKIRQDIKNKSILKKISTVPYQYQINSVPVIKNEDADNLDSDVKLIERCHHNFIKKSNKFHL